MGVPAVAVIIAAAVAETVGVVAVVRTGVPSLTFAWQTWSSCFGCSDGWKGAVRHLRHLKKRNLIF